VEINENKSGRVVVKKKQKKQNLATFVNINNYNYDYL